MKKIATTSVSLLAAAALLLVMMTASASAAATSSSKDMGKLNAAITLLNTYKSLPQGDQIFSKQLTENFKLSSDKVSSLLSGNMQYGDAAAVLAFADKMSGGVNDANINKVKSMKSTAGSWDQVAKNLNVKVSDVYSKLDSFEDTIHKNIKQALADSYTSGTAAGGTSESDSMSGGAAGGTSESDSMSGGATGGTGTTPGGMYGTENGSFGSGGISGGGAGGSEGVPSDTESGIHGEDSMSGGSTGGTGTTGGTGGSMDQPSSGSSSNPGSGY